MTAEKNGIVIVCGPTASGKSSLALKIAENFGGEIISADSMQIYRRLDVGTAKPTPEERARVPHHLIDIAEPYENYSVARFVRDANAAIGEVLAKGALPVVCGGTGLYIEALIHPTDYSEETEEDDGLRERLSALDAHSLWTLLNGIDPESAAKTHENNKKRVVRALEIYYLTGKTKTETDKLQKKYEPDHDVLTLITGFGDRGELYRRIDERIDAMIREGLVTETERALAANDLVPGTTAYQAIGYKELFPYVNGTATLESCVEKLKRATRNYAKRQLTWFSRYDGVRVSGVDDAFAAVRAFLERS